jgi:hypothetical protein
MALARDDHAGRIIVDVLADLDDFADELVADHHRDGNRLLRPLIPLVDVQIGAADGGALDLDQHVVGARFGLGHILEQAWRGLLLDERFHAFLRMARARTEGAISLIWRGSRWNWVMGMRSTAPGRDGKPCLAVR